MNWLPSFACVYKLFARVGQRFYGAANFIKAVNVIRFRWAGFFFKVSFIACLGNNLKKRIPPPVVDCAHSAYSGRPMKNDYNRKEKKASACGLFGWPLSKGKLLSVVENDPAATEPQSFSPAPPPRAAGRASASRADLAATADMFSFLTFDLRVYLLSRLTQRRN